MSVEFIHPQQSMHDLGQRVIDRIAVPKDHWEIAAQLEVMGMRDSDARADFLCRDIFELAERIFADFRNGNFKVDLTPDDRLPQRNVLQEFVLHYGNGLLLALPMAVQASTMLVWGYGIWGAIAFDLKTGTAIALGFIASYVATSGFAQAIVRRGLFYVYQGEEFLARHAAMSMWWGSLRIVVLAAVPLVLINFAYGFLPWTMVRIALFYYVALSILWLNLALIYLVQKSYLFVAVIAAGLIAAVMAVELGGVSLIAANAAALAVVDVLSFLIARANLDERARGKEETEIVEPPRSTIVVYSTAWFFFYGFLYSSFLFLDRILAWTSSTGREGAKPYMIWVSGEYELGMDLALMIIVLLAGVVEFATQRLSTSLVPTQKMASSTEHSAFNGRFARVHARQLVFLGILGIAALGFSYFVITILLEQPRLTVLSRLFSETTRNVFWIAGVSYVLLLIALQNILFLLTLARIETAVKLLAVAWLVDLVVGFVASRSIDYAAAVWGLLAGSLTLAVTATLRSRRILRELDYFYYAAY